MPSDRKWKRKKTTKARAGTGEQNEEIRKCEKENCDMEEKD